MKGRILPRNLALAAYTAWKQAKQAAQETGALGPPMHIRNAPTKLMKELGYGSGYSYDHDAEGAFSGQNYFPEEMERQLFYAPTSYGYEAEIKARLKRWAELRANKSGRKMIECGAVRS